MYPEIEIFGTIIKSYSLFAAIAAIVFAAMAWRPFRRLGFKRWQILTLFLLICAAFLIGARLWNVAISPGSYGPERPWYMLKMPGLSLYGGIAGALAVTVLFSKLSKKPLAAVFDSGTIPFAVAFSISRIGCFLNGCCGGVATSLPWGVRFPSALDHIHTSFIRLQSPAVHPTQLYELLLALIGIPICLFVIKKTRPGSGALFALYGAWFCLIRLAVLPLRSLPYPDIIKNIIYPALYVLLAAAGIFMFLRMRAKARA